MSLAFIPGHICPNMESDDTISSFGVKTSDRKSRASNQSVIKYICDPLTAMFVITLDHDF